MSLQLPWKFVVCPRYMDHCDLSAMMLVGGAYTWVSACVPNYTIQCLEKSKVKSFMMVQGGYVCDIPTIGGKAFSHRTTNMTISM